MLLSLATATFSVSLSLSFLHHPSLPHLLFLQPLPFTVSPFCFWPQPPSLFLPGSLMALQLIHHICFFYFYAIMFISVSIHSFSPPLSLSVVHERSELISSQLSYSGTEGRRDCQSVCASLTH